MISNDIRRRGQLSDLHWRTSCWECSLAKGRTECHLWESSSSFSSEEHSALKETLQVRSWTKMFKVIALPHSFSSFLYFCLVLVWVALMREHVLVVIVHSYLLSSILVMCVAVVMDSFQSYKIALIEGHSIRRRIWTNSGDFNREIWLNSLTCFWSL